MPIMMTTDEYEALLAWAKEGATDLGKADDFLGMRKKIDFTNGINRHALLIRYDKLPQEAHPGITGTPRGKTKLLEMTRRPSREDVLRALHGEVYDERLVWVTTDLHGEVGFYELGAFPF